ncbi:hypothetical protein B0J15DRAFT_123124 [Fusarium solani]|uniref:Uncharacterized protein n=1 Tax=Fusarium solani TaxID=169388 RepID=A0A9P9RCR4_FUSSL|nr:uncharacterized protein B0J15DRAFT_123124 [Fusarium solani]KAH7274207.1 hypothetical protein B0J15DRAFT_123124 [Fusarium solani]
MALNWFSQIFPCLSVRRAHDSTDVPDVAPETRSVSGRSLSSERRYVTERSPSVESRFSAQRGSFERRPSLESLPLEGPPPKGHEETLSWLDYGNDSGVIAARDAADREIRKSLSSEGGEISYGATEAIRIQRDFGRDENGLDLFAVGSPGSAGPFTPGSPPVPPTKETPSRRRSPCSRDPSSLDVTRFDRSPPSSTVSSPCGSRPTDRSQLDLPYAGAVWPFGVGYESFSERINALSLAVPKNNQAAEEDIGWKRGSVNSRRPVLHIDTQLKDPLVRPRAALVESSPENGSQAHKLPELPPIVPPYNHGSHEDDSPKLTTVLTLASEMIRGLDDDNGSSLDGSSGSPTMPVKDSGFGSMTSDGDSRPDVHPESPVIDRLVDDNNVNPDASVDSPTSIKTDSTTIEALIDDITGFLDGIAASCAIINGAPEADRMADDSNSHIEVRSEPSPPSPMVSVG